MREYQSVDHSSFTHDEEQAALAAVLAEYEALRAEVVRLRGELEAARFRPMTERPAENGQACEVILNASYIYSNHPDDEDAPGYWIGDRMSVYDDLVLAWRPKSPSGEEGR